MSDLTDQISALLSGPAQDVERIERTLTDGYARALALEAERWRLERRVVELSREIEHGDVARSVHELSETAKRLQASGGDLSELRGLLTQLRRHAEDARIGSPL